MDGTGLEVEFCGWNADGVTGIAHGFHLVFVEVAVGTADHDADLDHRARLIRLRLVFADGLDRFDSTEIGVVGQLVAVEIELGFEFGRRENFQRFVAADERGGFGPLARVDCAVGSRDEGAHRHAGVGELLVLELRRLSLQLRVHRRGVGFELIPEAHKVWQCNQQCALSPSGLAQFTFLLREVEPRLLVKERVRRSRLGYGNGAEECRSLPTPRADGRGISRHIILIGRLNIGGA